jgi:iron complex outermembrane receptor protein
MPLLSSVRTALVAAIVVAAAFPIRARAQEVKDTTTLQEIEVTSTRSSTRLRNTAPVPVDVIPVEPQARLGNPELTQILNYVAPSFESYTQTQTDGNDHLDLARLRGLGADQVLVLINGKRRHTTALLHLGDNIGQGTTGVDLNSIPAAAIDRVEILRDGAAAQYGSDAIAGVINIILKSNAEGGTISSLTGVSSQGDGESARVDGNYGFKIGQTGFLNVTAEYRHRNPTNRVGTWTGNVYFGNLFNFGAFGPHGEYNSQAEYQADLDSIAARGFDLTNVQRIGDSRLTNATLFANTAIPIGDSAEVYGFGGLTSREGEASAFYRFPADQNVSDLTLYPDGYLPFINTTITDKALTGGVRSTRGGWTFDVSNTYGANSFGFGVSNSLNGSLRDQSPTNFDAGTLVYAQNTTRLDLSRRLGEATGRSVNLSLGTEYRTERYQIVAGDEASWKNYATALGDTTANGGRYDSGSEGFPGYQPINEVNRSRTNIGLYAEAEANLSSALVLDVAGRYEDYSDFGDRVIGKAAALYRINRRFALRGAVNNGFRAPSLAQLYTNKVSTFFIGNREVQVGLFNNLSSVTRALGVGQLTPEKSTNVSAGFTATPVNRLTLSADGYMVWVDDRIVASGVIDRGGSPKVDAALAAFPDVQAVQFFSNALNTRTRGLDLQVRYPFLVGTGVLTVSGAANFNKTVIRGGVRKPTGLGAGTPLFNRQEVRRGVSTSSGPTKWSRRRSWWI